MDINELFNECKRLLKELVLYGVIGLFSASIDTLSFYLLRRYGLLLPVANFIGVNIGIFLSFFLNTYLNFKKTTELKKRAVTFFFVGYCGLAVSSVIMYVGVRRMGKWELAVKVLSVMIVAGLQFLLNKFITFRA